MRSRITEAVCAADTMFRACLAASELAGRIIDMDITDSSAPTPSPRSLGVTAFVHLPDGRRVDVIANCHIVQTDAGWTDGLCELYGVVGSEKLTRYILDMSVPNPAPAVY